MFARIVGVVWRSLWAEIWCGYWAFGGTALSEVVSRVLFMSTVLAFPPAPSLTVAVEELRVAMGSLASQVAAGALEGLSASDLLAVAAELHALGSQLEAVTVSAVAEVAEGEVELA